jgi:hypothetical protein
MKFRRYAKVRKTKSYAKTRKAMKNTKTRKTMSYTKSTKVMKHIEKLTKRTSLKASPSPLLPPCHQSPPP